MSRPATNPEPTSSILPCRDRSLDLTKTVIMGILNVTPDSFSDGGLFMGRERALRHAAAMVADGADIIDVGGESTRPGAGAVSVQEELDRVVPAIEAVRDAFDLPISVDTTKPEVMHAAVAAGADMINDVNALQAPGAVDVARDTGTAVCLMHMQGQPATMQQAPCYGDVVAEVGAYLAQRRDACINSGISPEKIVVDPGFGFGKNDGHNLELLRGLRGLKALGSPVLVGLSRKSMIGRLLGLAAQERTVASVVLAVIAVQNGASIVRVHDVKATRDGIRMLEAVVLPR